MANVENTGPHPEDFQDSFEQWQGEYALENARDRAVELGVVGVDRSLAANLAIAIEKNSQLPDGLATESTFGISLAELGNPERNVELLMDYYQSSGEPTDEAKQLMNRFIKQVKESGQSPRGQHG